ncbi:MAG: amidohydrolase family protein [Actinomycetota bacterium]|nr:amidohydrolase family protein [Actinomycetota bacterium]
MATTSEERLISADDHVEMSHDRVKEFLAARYHAGYDAGVDAFYTAMAKSRSSEANQRWRDQNAFASKATTGGTDSLMYRRHAAAGRPGHSDAAERLKDMDTDGVAASSSYCEVSAFRYLYLIKEGWRESTRAFNTALAAWTEADPGRLIVSYQIPIHDIGAAVDEVRWVAESGGKSLQLPVFPNELGLPDYWDQRYDPLWAAVQEADLPICLHIGLNTALDDLARRDPTPQRGIFVPMTPLSTGEQFGMWIMGGVFARYPRLKVVFVEPGIGWVAWWLNIVDDMATRQGYEFPAITELPSYYFKRNVFLTFIDEPHVVRHAHETLGIENVMWSSDYPHPVSSWPHSRKIVDEIFAGATPEDRHLVVNGNATRVWNL